GRGARVLELHRQELARRQPDPQLQRGALDVDLPLRTAALRDQGPGGGAAGADRDRPRVEDLGHARADDPVAVLAEGLDLDGLRPRPARSRELVPHGRLISRPPAAAAPCYIDRPMAHEGSCGVPLGGSFSLVREVLAGQAVADLGCNRGYYLRACGPGSVGL